MTRDLAKENGKKKAAAKRRSKSRKREFADLVIRLATMTMNRSQDRDVWS
jgi:hypothetical protein